MSTVEPDIERALNDLSPSEKRLVRSAEKSLLTLVCAFIILLGVCIIWMRHYRLFIADRFFLVYNIIIYLALVWAAFWTYTYERRVYQLLAKLLRKLYQQTKV